MFYPAKKLSFGFLFSPGLVKKSIFLSCILDKTCQLHKEQFAFSHQKRDMFLLCAFLAEEGDIIVFSHRAIAAEE